MASSWARRCGSAAVGENSASVVGCTVDAALVGGGLLLAQPPRKLTAIPADNMSNRFAKQPPVSRGERLARRKGRAVGAALLLLLQPVGGRRSHFVTRQQQFPEAI